MAGMFVFRDEDEAENNFIEYMIANKRQAAPEWYLVNNKNYFGVLIDCDDVESETGSVVVVWQGEDSPEQLKIVKERYGRYSDIS
ncbi:MAG: hypothetical protein MK086_14765 [Flavobacteriales bacterium]|nr:hypothetical protein [Flavobacteriales bacterium]